MSGSYPSPGYFADHGPKRQHLIDHFSRNFGWFLTLCLIELFHRFYIELTRDFDNDLFLLDTYVGVLLFSKPIDCTPQKRKGVNMTS